MDKTHLTALTTFVRGMAWHDMAKPLYLNNPAHAMLGYVLLHAFQREPEALAALLHTGPEFRLPVYWAHQGWSDDKSLPAHLALASALDMLASVSYSLEEEDEEEEDKKRRKKKQLPQPSAQNPFSRLPLRLGDKPVAVRGSSGDLAARLLRKSFRQRVALSQEAKDYLTVLEDRRDAALEPDEINALVSALERIPGIWEVLQEYQDIHGERTYPAANDTALQEHSRLSAILAYVVYANLLSSDSDFLSHRIVRQKGNFVVDGYEPPMPVDRCRQRKTVNMDQRARGMLTGGLSCQLVRVCFAGLQDAFESAVRLDDLTGVRELLKPDDPTRPSLKTAFKRHFTLQLLKLSCPEATMADVDDGLPGSTLADILPLTEGLFDAVYLLPSCYAKDKIEKAALEAYQEAWDEIARERVMPVIWGDFGGFAGLLGLKDWDNEVRAQLQRLTLSVAVRPVATPELEQDNFRKWMADFGGQLLKTFKGIRDTMTVSEAQLKGWLAQAKQEQQEGLDAVCDVCGTNPADPTFNQLVPVEPRLQIVVHQRGNEWEQICRSCIGRRALAHGVRKSAPLSRMIQPNGTGYIKVGQSECEHDPKPPPALLQGHFPLEENQHKDLIAAYVRWRKDGDGLDVFPTVSYAADREGNVALLTLTASEALFGLYNYDPDSAQSPAPVKKTEETDVDYWHTFYREVVNEAREKAPHLVKGMLHVEPHLARVMTRIRLLDQFYSRLPSVLEGVPLRALSLQAEYPVVRVLVPADQVTKALEALEKSLAKDLFSAIWKDCEAETRQLLAQVLPPLLLGAAVVFKEKYPLYLVLEAERLLVRRLAEADPARLDGGKRRDKETTEWTGLRLGLCDLRGTLAEKGPWQGQVLWRDLGDTIALAGEVDRVTVLRQGILSWDDDLVPLAQALTYIRADRTRLSRAMAEQLCQDTLFRPVLFLKHLTRE